MKIRGIFLNQYENEANKDSVIMIITIYNMIK